MLCSRYVINNMLQLLMINNLLHLQMQILFHGKGGSCVFEGYTTQSYLFTLDFPCGKGEFLNTPTRHYPRTCICRCNKLLIIRSCNILSFTYLEHGIIHTGSTYLITIKRERPVNLYHTVLFIYPGFPMWERGVPEHSNKALS
jgi:hypothetical protein